MIIFDRETSRYNVRRAGRWSYGQTDAQVEQLGYSLDDRMTAQLHSLPVYDVTFDGQRYHIGPIVCHVTDARAHLKERGLTGRETEAILKTARLEARLANALADFVEHWRGRDSVRSPGR